MVSNYRLNYISILDRKTRAVHLYQAGIPLELLAQFLGHNDPMTTLIYARADNEMSAKQLKVHQL